MIYFHSLNNLIELFFDEETRYNSVLALPAVQAQRRLLVEVKQDLNALTLTVDSYQNALNKLKPALTNDETKEDAETWYVAGKIAYSKYDKYRK